MSNSQPENHSHGPAPHKRGKCPRCGHTFEYTTIAEHKVFPFCSPRCRNVDLGNWFSNTYAIPGKPLPPAMFDPEAADDGT